MTHPVDKAMRLRVRPSGHRAEWGDTSGTFVGSQARFSKADQSTTRKTIGKMVENALVRLTLCGLTG